MIGRCAMWFHAIIAERPESSEVDNRMSLNILE